MATVHKMPYIPKGCDQQGRIPEAAHAASEIDQDDLPRPAKKEHDGMLIAAAWGVGAFLCVFALIGIGKGIAYLFGWGGA